MARMDAQGSSRSGGAWKKRLAWMASAAAVIGVCVMVRYYWGPSGATAQVRTTPQPRAQQAKPGTATAAPATSPQNVMAVVDNTQITRHHLASACLRRHGKDVLESLVNRHLITQHCQASGIAITQQDIDAEIAKNAKRFQLGVEEWLKMLQRERGIGPEEYARDIIWPTVALRRLAANQLTVSNEELQREYESQFGEAVQARLISLSDGQVAKQLHAQLVARPSDFASVAQKYSGDINSASIGGMLPPVRRHVGDPQIEQTLFSLQPSQISAIIPVGDLFVILKCEGRIPARNISMAQVQSRLTEAIREKKLKVVADDLFKQLQKNAQITNVMNDPNLSRQYPGVAATINGQQLTTDQLGEECLARYGEVVLEGEIHRLLLDQALRRANTRVTRIDLDAEIAHAAKLAGVVRPDGSADLDRWFKLIAEHQQISREDYIHDSVWPSAALKKLVQSKIEITEDDVQKGFEANYGPRMQCRAIMTNNLRKAQEAWSKARQDSSIENFGEIAAQYSIEPSAKALRGQVPPLRRHGGQPLLEEAAFKLQPGEMSGIVDVGNHYVILFCESYTEPIKVEPAEVRELLIEDITEKKTRMEMSKQFEQIRQAARIDNYLTGEGSAPNRHSRAPAATASDRG